MSVRRELVRACIHPRTFKYFFTREQVVDVWRALEEQFGTIDDQPGFGVLQINTPTLVFRATRSGNPITVIRKRRCTQDDVAAVHALFGFEEK